MEPWRAFQLFLRQHVMWLLQLHLLSGARCGCKWKYNIGNNNYYYYSSLRVLYYLQWVQFQISWHCRTEVEKWEGRCELGTHEYTIRDGGHSLGLHLILDGKIQRHGPQAKWTGAIIFFWEVEQMIMMSEESVFKHYGISLNTEEPEIYRRELNHLFPIFRCPISLTVCVWFCTWSWRQVSLSLFLCCDRIMECKQMLNVFSSDHSIQSPRSPILHTKKDIRCSTRCSSNAFVDSELRFINRGQLTCIETARIKNRQTFGWVWRRKWQRKSFDSNLLLIYSHIINECNLCSIDF